jgi:hypothetical protein
MDLLVGRDNCRIFPELSQEACLMGDKFFILFSPGQVIYGAATKEHPVGEEPREPRRSQKAAIQVSGQREEEGKGQAEAS